MRQPQKDVGQDEDDRAELLSDAKVRAIDAISEAELGEEYVRAEEHEESGDGVDDAFRKEHATAPERSLRAVHWRESGVEFEIQIGYLVHTRARHWMAEELCGRFGGFQIGSLVSLLACVCPHAAHDDSLKQPLQARIYNHLV